MSITCQERTRSHCLAPQCKTSVGKSQDSRSSRVTLIIMLYRVIRTDSNAGFLLRQTRALCYYYSPPDLRGSRPFTINRELIISTAHLIRSLRLQVLYLLQKFSVQIRAEGFGKLPAPTEKKNASFNNPQFRGKNGV